MEQNSRPVYSGVLTEEAIADPNNTHAVLLHLVGYHRRVLEIGPATGYMSRVLVEHQGCSVTGFELSPIAAVEAQPLLHEIIVGNLEEPADLARIHGRYDVILMADVVEHLAEPGMALRALRSHLQDGGRLLVSIPNIAHWTARRALLLGRWDLTDRGLMDRTHLRWYTRSSAEHLLELAGYRIAQYRCSYVFPAHWRLGSGQRFAAWAQRRTMPGPFDGLFAIQSIFVAVSP